MASPTEASPPSADWPNKDTVPQESPMNLMDGWADRFVLTNQPRRLAQIAGRLNYTKQRHLGGWWQDKRLIKMMKIKTRKRQHRSLTETEFKTKLKVEVKKAQREDSKGIFCPSITKPFGSHQRPQGSPKEVNTTNISHSCAYLYLFSPSSRRRKGHTSLAKGLTWRPVLHSGASYSSTQWVDLNSCGFLKVSTVKTIPNPIPDQEHHFELPLLSLMLLYWESLCVWAYILAEGRNAGEM